MYTASTQEMQLKVLFFLSPLHAVINDTVRNICTSGQKSINVLNADNLNHSQNIKMHLSDTYNNSYQMKIKSVIMLITV